jgi:uncharacterized protein YabE (DUF348 family)
MRRIIYLAVVFLILLGFGVLATSSKAFNMVNIRFSDGHEITVLTRKTTVSEVLKENHIYVLEDEMTLPSLDSSVDNNGIIKIYKQSDINTISVLAKKRRKFH